MGFSGFDYMMFSAIPNLVMIGFVLTFGVMIFIIIGRAREWSSNNASPVLSVEARLVAKRTSISRHSHHQGGDMSMHHTSNTTTYYATFEVESGDRMEFCMPSREFGLLVEGDEGKLTFQGTRYKGFERRR